jgi:hypothetical protein
MDKSQGDYGNQMQVKDLDGNSSNWQLIGNISHGSVQNKSSLHLKARELIHECFPTLQVLEEVPVNIRRSETLYLDFYLPLIKRCVEVHGEQHYKFNRFFHNTPLGFIKHKKRDQEKRDWCELNGIEYIELPFDNIEEWITRIKNEYQRTSE